MKQTAVLLWLGIVASLSAISQTQHLRFSHNCKDYDPPFTRVRVMDRRTHNQTVGYIQKGAFNRLVLLGYEGNIGDGIAPFFTSKDTTDPNKKELVVILNELFLSENAGQMSEVARTKISLRLFIKTPNQKYVEILKLDSAYYQKSGWDVTDKLLSSASERFCEIAKIAGEKIKLQEPNNLKEYSTEELRYLDSLEKRDLPIYSVTKAKKGLYKDYNAFKMNVPDSSDVFIDTSKSRKIKVYVWNKEKTKKQRIYPNAIYAASDGEIILKANSTGFFTLKKVKSDFVYTGTIGWASTTGGANGATVAAVMAGAMLGAASGVMITPVYTKKNIPFIFKINHLYGNSIPIGVPPE